MPTKVKLYDKVAAILGRSAYTGHGFTSTALAARTDATQEGVTHVLNTMRAAGLVRRDRDGHGYSWAWIVQQTVNKAEKESP